MADAKLRIVIDALNKASDDLGKLKKDLQGVDDATKNASKGTKQFGTDWASVITGINQGLETARKVAQAIEVAYDFAVEAAALERLETASHTMAESVGMDMDDIVESVKAASLGMVSESDIMASASRALMLGVGSNAEELAALMETAAIRGQAMGVSTEQAFNDIVTGIGRQSRMILDNLGIVLDLNQVYADYAISVGKSVDDLEDFEKKQAMVNAVLEDSQDLLDTTGGLVLDNMGQWEKLGAQYEDYMDSVKKGTAGPLAELAKMLNVHLGEWNLDKNFRDLKSQLKEAGMDVKEFDKAWKDNQNFLGWVIDQEYAMQLLKDYEQALGNQKNAASNAAKADADYYGYVKDSIAPTEDATEATQGLADATISADLAMRSYNDALLFSIASEGLSSEAALSLAKAMGLVDENTMYAASQTDTLRQRLEDGIITNEQYEAAVANLADELDRIQSKSVTIDITTIRREIDELKRVGRDGVQAFTKASGGAVSAGNLYNWQEYGYRGEAFVPSQDGYVLSRSDAARIMQGGGGGADMAAIVSRIPTAQDIARAVRDAILMVT